MPTVEVTLTPGDVIAICRVVYAAARALRGVVGELVSPEWELAPDSIRNEVEEGVRLIGARRVSSPTGLHAIQRDRMIKDGWRYGPIHEPHEKRHPIILDWDELATVDQAKYVVFFDLTVSMLRCVGATRAQARRFHTSFAAPQGGL